MILVIRDLCFCQEHVSYWISIVPYKVGKVSERVTSSYNVESGRCKRFID